ncbi:tektin-1 isoform X2 [Chironomus tepperi]|uniref:tektin-1 isoform X2 n=1 Tax=Chironomus tepperi TaxID=113505 RepID=UPI00391FC6E2
MCDFEAEILRLNLKIKELMGRVDQNMSRSSRFEAENKRLSVEVEQMKEVCSRTSAINVRYQQRLEEERSVKEELLEGNAKLKQKVNDLSTRCFQQNEHIRMLESNLRRATNVSMRASRVPVRLIGSVSEIIQNVDPTTTQPYIDLQKKYNELESEHQEALVIIDELEFELGDIDYLEMEILRLQQENVKLRESLEPTNYSEYAGGYSATIAPASAMSYGADSSDHTTMKAFTAMKLTDNEDGEEEEQDNGEFVNELKTIHSRKLMMQQKLDNFHARKSNNFVLDDE